MNVRTMTGADAAAFAAPSATDRIQMLALAAGVLGLLGGVAGFLMGNQDYFFRAYLVGWVFCAGLCFGSLGLLMLSHMSGGDWGVLARRIFEASTRTLPYVAVLMIPLLFGLDKLYYWAKPASTFAKDAVLSHKAAYLNVPFFIERQVAYFLILGLIAFLLNRMSLAQDRTAETKLNRRMKVVAAPGLVIYALLMTFASVDWMMSLEGHWMSTIYGFYLIASQALAAHAFTILIVFFLSRSEPMSRVFARRHFHDYGKLMLAFTMLWTYFCFSQFLITWAGNLPEEITWYLHRTRNGWGVVALLVVTFHFALPFLFLLSATVKKQPKVLATVAGTILLMRVIDIFWQVEPSFAVQARSSYWLFVAVPVGLFGLWLFLFFWELKKRPLLPVQDPYLAEAMVAEAKAHG